MACDALHALVAAATTVDGREAAGPAELQTEREKRKMTASLQRFEDMQKKETRKRRKNASASALLGKIVWKQFPGKSGPPKWYQGEVLSVSYAKRGKSMYKFAGGITSTVKCLVEYSDRDSEDMTPSQVRKLLVD